MGWASVLAAPDFGKSGAGPGPEPASLLVVRLSRVEYFAGGAEKQELPGVVEEGVELVILALEVVLAQARESQLNGVHPKRRLLEAARHPEPTLQ